MKNVDAVMINVFSYTGDGASTNTSTLKSDS